MKSILLAAVGMALGHGALAEDGPAPLKTGAGENLATAYCNACHTSDYIVMNSPFLSPEQWKAEVMKMRSAFGAPIDNDTAAAITAYLGASYVATNPSSSFPASRTGRAP